MQLVNYLIERLQLLLGKSKVPRDIVSTYEQDYKSLLSRSVYLQRYKNESFDTKEFAHFLNIQNKIMQDRGAYKGLRQAAFMLEAAIDTSDNLRLIFETELQYRSSAQKQFYNYVIKVLSSSDDGKKINHIFDRHLEKNLNKIQTEEGRKIILDYISAIKEVANHNFGTTFFLSCKANQTDAFNTITTVAKIARSMRKKDLNKLQTTMIQVHANFGVFKELSKALGIQNQKDLTKAFAMMLQYLALKHRYSKSSREFERFLKHLKVYSNHLRSMTYVLNEYGGNKYIQPEVMKQTIPCKSIYKNYKKYINDYQIIRNHKQHVLAVPKPQMLDVEDSEASMIFRVVQKESRL